MNVFTTAALLTVAALAVGTAPAQAQININIGQPAPRYVVVREGKPMKKWKGPKHQKGAVLLVPAGPVYYEGRGHGRGRGRH